MFKLANNSLWNGENLYKNQSVFVILSGPSINNYDLTKLNQPGIVTFGVNNSPSIFRPDLWVCVDEASSFLHSIWSDPKILKFAPAARKQNKLFDSSKVIYSGKTPNDCPNVVYFDLSVGFDSSTFFQSSTLNYGNETPGKNKDKFTGGRSVMLPMLRICTYLGFKNIYLLGADFKMSEDKPYGFDEQKSKSESNANNDLFFKLAARFALLKPQLEQMGVKVYNCFKSTNYKVFDYISFDHAIKQSLKNFPNPAKEQTKGLYNKTLVPTYTHRGHSGDMIYALAALDQLPAYNLIIKPGKSRFDENVCNQWKDYLQTQKKIKNITVNKNGGYNRVFDSFGGGELKQEALINHFCRIARLPEKQPQQWLTANKKKNIPRVLFNKTQQYPNEEFDWAGEVNKYQDDCGFVGTKSEYIKFIEKYKVALPHLETPTKKDLVETINSCDFFIGNQSLCFALAEALNKPACVVVCHKKPTPVHENRKNVYHWWDKLSTVPTLSSSVNWPKEIYKQDYELHLLGLKRSGNHAITQWLLNLFEEKYCLHLNDVKLDKLLFNKYNRAHKTRNKRATIISLEDYKELPDATVFTPQIGFSKQIKQFTVIRSFPNFLASRLEKKRRSHINTPREFKEYWLAHTKHENLIIFDKWFSDPNYRLSLVQEHFGMNKDADVNQMMKWGEGSSFDGMTYNGNAQKMNVLNRYEKYKDFELFKNACRDEQIVRRSKELGIYIEI